MNKLGMGCGVLAVLGGIVVVIALAVMLSYNGLVRRAQNVDSKWAQVQTDYQRRADLIPNLVSTVSGAANFEKSTLEAVTQARASVGRVQIDPTKAPTDPKQTRGFPERAEPAWFGVVAAARGVGELSAVAGHLQF